MRMRWSRLRLAASLPIAVSGALMPDAHLGYGLPIGGVLATDNAVIPYAVGVDIACRMKLSVLDVPVDALEHQADRLAKILGAETVFGAGGVRKKPADHPVLTADWKASDITRNLFDKAASQLGTSGSGNHFVEFGTLSLDRDELGLKAGKYFALLSHSGSRGAGAAVADHFSKLAMALHAELPQELKRLAWLDLDSDAGREYWRTMELMGEYASANHAIIHEKIAAALGGAGFGRSGEPSQFRVEGDARGTRGRRASQGGNAGFEGDAWGDSGVDGFAGVCGARARRGEVAEFGLRTGRDG